LQLLPAWNKFAATSGVAVAPEEQLALEQTFKRRKTICFVQKLILNKAPFRDENEKKKKNKVKNYIFTVLKGFVCAMCRLPHSSSPFTGKAKEANMRKEWAIVGELYFFCLCKN
jgi:hypothetical protein